MTSQPTQSLWSPSRTDGPFLGFADAAGSAVGQLNQQLAGMDLWLVTRAVADRHFVVASVGRWVDLARAGTELSWQAGFCLQVVSGRAPLVVPDIACEPKYRRVAVGPLARVRGYLGVPLLVGDGQLFGTLCALSGTPQPATLRDALPTVSLLGRMLCTVLAGERAAHDRSVEAARAYALADRDPLTDLPNRRGFEHAVRIEQGRGERFGTRSSIVAITLDRPGTDPAAPADDLRRCAEVLTALCQAGDVAARVDGTEFALLAVQTAVVDGRALQSRLRQGLRAAGLPAYVGVATRLLREDLNETWTRAERAMRADRHRRTHLPVRAVL